MQNIFLKIASLSGLFAVALGAFGAHALKNRLDSYAMNVYQTAVQYHFIHTLTLLAVGVLAMTWQNPWLKYSGWLFVGGILVFSGSLYLLAFSGVKILGAITPIGGLLLMAGWVGLFLAAIRA